MFDFEESRMVWAMNWAFTRFWVVTHIEACMIWVGVGSGGTWLDWVSDNSHICGFLVALHACWMGGADVAEERPLRR